MAGATVAARRRRRRRRHPPATGEREAGAPGAGPAAPALARDRPRRGRPFPRRRGQGAGTAAQLSGLFFPFSLALWGHGKRAFPSSRETGTRARSLPLGLAQRPAGTDPSPDSGPPAPLSASVGSFLRSFAPSSDPERGWWEGWGRGGPAPRVFSPPAAASNGRARGGSDPPRRVRPSDRGLSPGRLARQQAGRRHGKKPRRPAAAAEGAAPLPPTVVFYSGFSPVLSGSAAPPPERCSRPAHPRGTRTEASTGTSRASGHLRGSRGHAAVTQPRFGKSVEPLPPPPSSTEQEEQGRRGGARTPPPTRSRLLLARGGLGGGGTKTTPPTRREASWKGDRPA